MTSFNASLYILSAAALWSLGGVLIKGVTWDSLAIAGIRSFIAGSVLFAVFHRKISPKWSPLVFIGAILYAATVVLFVMATKSTTSANAILLQYAAPIYLAMLSPWVLKERIYYYDWLAIVIGLAGVLLTLKSGVNLAFNIGDVLALLSGVFFAGMILVMRKLGKSQTHEYANVEVALFGNLLAAGFCVFGMPEHLSLTPQNIGGIMSLGCIQLALLYFLYSKGIQFLPAIEATLLQMIEPILNPLWVFLAMNERPSIYSVYGGALILGATILRMYLQKMRLSPKSGMMQA